MTKDKNTDKTSAENFLKKFWFIVWQDDSPKGWIITIIFIFIIIKYVFFPLVSLATGTALPLAIVESCSMYHENNLFSDFDSWWEEHEGKYEKFDIDKNEFREFPLRNGFTKGDILLITGTEPENIETGDIIIFEGGTRNPIIHRVIEKNEEEITFSTIGDNNNQQIKRLGLDESEIKDSQIVGKTQLKLLPYAGWVKLIFFETYKAIDNNPRTNFEGFCKEK